MKKDYFAPEYELEKFTIYDIVTSSNGEGIGDGDNTTDPFDPNDDF